MPLAPSILNQNSELGDGASAAAIQEGVNLEVDSNTDLPHEYF
eukprot:CAMPEP_0185574392 /NCGR_PEP_ID=MMETSP0434-20130131/5871_1 /TAXON_ID=626734 ORGANISM="Favella taraikaensis, Strain Fe Narragansett Bay" /NCGR_SAMPLE_ID=MMETSP0434 /ASSEMBLY_ACC=CAM_ASM_000379 /LENGTH=42 /DNA_ID= /DNA_START= /DNA_END= /DNA_ORIENTATION=